MCKLCDEGESRHHFASRRRFLKGAAAAGIGAAGLSLFAARPAAADAAPMDSGRPGRRYLIRGGSVMSMDPAIGDFAEADVLVEGKKILAVGPNLQAGGAAEIDARDRIVMPGFIDTHHHQFETVLRSFLATGCYCQAHRAGTSIITSTFSSPCPGVPAAGRLHQRAVRWAQPARRRRHDGA
jgi:5-methylthioadenosine/S-adenosylhomocysteine deaminase